ncbi:MAG: EAL domain-containing protein [Candidatus Thiodiazotropha sp. (ex Lucina aurantia)]|uniref:cyclic-guanylate-specific phosphodiesterase n=1 Tax=Candidatus Thiodiazotropha taylori TaxID=2792791 RepID=A0A9E4NLM8_9GAMM|nr:EAL domain-containing protein [Candidatus Thiodiazotropha sp. (ex Lucina pensylvanica)]MBT3017723.1 EAL domain-containing protein [Candidatus Thiodiazotropha taylori]MBT3040826.1 EAL domain-containing protein [Candidatus Thiodiazotropha sp. (ex Codakia orbicularis)]MBV2103889.1 EAL domain-containing protein [Candidatus Thiodiazotropha sp. (ex Lucina aurantia)]MCG7861164.1 EAL domain-containing protein [Candidatus Thiodiazotropha endolucinida]
MHPYYPAPWRGIEGNFESLPTDINTNRPKRSNNARILIADDEPRARASLKEILRFTGYETTLAECGSEAIDLLNSASFDLILLDLNMPDLHGHKVMEHIDSYRLNCDIIVVSGETTFDHATMALRKGAQDFLRKPYAPDELLRSVANVLERRQLKATNQSIQLRLQESESLHKFIVNNSPDMIYLLDHEGRFAFINERVKSLLGYDQKEIIGEHFSKLIHTEDIERAHFTFNERRAGERATRSAELKLSSKNNNGSRFFDSGTVPVELSSIGIYTTNDDKTKSFIGTYGVARDISERKQAEELIKYQLYHDLLTNLPNRSLFRDRLNMAMAQSKRSGKKLAIMYLDMDRFKIINDSLGHYVGDELLKMVGQRLRSELREADTLARVGGDEFNLLVPEINDIQDARNLAEKILRLTLEPFIIKNEEIFISFSIGISIYPSDGDTKDSLIKHADIAMYKVKNAGKNGYAFYSEKMKAHFSQSLDIENGLRKAISTNELCLYYQPQFDINNGYMKGVEALVRWKHPEKGTIQPNEFISVAEESGLIIPLGEWVLRRACTDIKRWMEQEGISLQLSVNISMQQLEMDQFVNKALKIIKRHQLPKDTLELEITEHAIMQDMEKAIDALTKLSHKGIRIAIDDFGTGYSSLGYLQNLPINTLKIDRSFVQGIKTSEDNSIIDAIIAMAKGLNLNLIAEGVENQTQIDHLSRAGCGLAQGFFYSHPVPEDELLKFIKLNGNTNGQDSADTIVSSDHDPSYQ